MRQGWGMSPGGAFLSGGRRSRPTSGPPCAGRPVHRERVDHVGPAITVGIPEAQGLGGDRVAVGLVEDQDESFTATLYPA